MNPRNRAYMIAIEGSDGAGKETQTTLLRAAFEAKGKKVVSVSFPRYNHTRGGKLLFEAFKSLRSPQYDFANAPPEAASLIYAADRIESLPFLQELMSSHDVLIFDRYVESNLLHQGGKFDEERREAFANWLYELEYGMNKMPRPDLMLYLSVPFSVSIKRAHDRAQLKGERPDFLEQDEKYVRNGSEAGLFYAKLLGWKIINCTRDEGGMLYELTTAEVNKEILKALPEDIFNG